MGIWNTIVCIVSNKKTTFNFHISFAREPTADMSAKQCKEPSKACRVGNHFLGTLLEEYSSRRELFRDALEHNKYINNFTCTKTEMPRFYLLFKVKTVLEHVANSNKFALLGTTFAKFYVRIHNIDGFLYFKYRKRNKFNFS